MKDSYYVEREKGYGAQDCSKNKQFYIRYFLFTESDNMKKKNYVS